DKSYEIIPSKPPSSASSLDSGFSSDPLSELLEGRPKGSELSKKVPKVVLPSASNRPFPSRLLRSTE
ncbi:MAG: hypothetical protein VW312_04440, partial [Opitutales bacterium]